MNRVARPGGALWRSLLLTLCMPSWAGAQLAGAETAGACGDFSPPRQLEISVAAGAPAGDVVVAAVALAPVEASGLQMRDTRGNVFTPLGTRRARGDGSSVLLLASRLATGIGAGDRLQLQLDDAPDGARACVIALSYRDLLLEPLALRASATATGQGTGASVHATSAVVAQARLAAFGIEGAPGPVTASAGASLQATRCSADLALCLVLAHAEGDVGSAAAADITLSFGNTQAWQGAVAILPRLSLFADGLEN